jgi:hypothetical protein
MTIQAKSDSEPIFIQRQHLVDEEIVLGSVLARDRLLFSTVERCTVKFINSDLVGMSGTRFIKCSFHPTRTVQSNWSGAAWDECTFYGHYVSTHFGQTSVHPDAQSDGYLIKKCDFSCATMQLCVFTRTDTATTTFSRWPSFTLLDPEVNRKAWMEAKLPFKNRFLDGSSLSHANAITFYWPYLVDHAKSLIQKLPNIAPRDVVDADPEEVREAISKLDFVRV